MSSDTDIVEDLDPLKLDYIPAEITDREKQKKQLLKSRGGHFFIHGPRGTGKTTLIHTTLRNLPDEVNRCYIPCTVHDTQYKVLKQVYQQLTQEKAESGYHTSDLQRWIEKRTGAQKTIIALDEIDFLLQNDGEDLLYFLSRLTGQLQIILSASNHSQIKDQVEERTYSSLQPRRINCSHYTAETAFKILRQRAQHSLKPKTLHRSALTYIASTTQNLSHALTWLQTAAEKAESKITENTIQRTEDQAKQNYADYLLQEFTKHHRLLYQAIQELASEHGEPVNTGEVYDRYHELTETYSEESVSNRRISTFIKHLELLQLIQSEYHYGGNTGKTREIKLSL